MIGNRERVNVPFLESISLKKGKRKAMTRIKQIAKVSKEGNINIYEENKSQVIWSLRWIKKCLL